MSAEDAEVVRKEEAWDTHLSSTLVQLSVLYEQRIAPIEERYEYNVYRPSWFAESIKQRKPFVTFLGPFSAGKSSFINYLLQDDYLLTGPQPVTDKFTVIFYGEKVQHIPGQVLVADSRLPFRGLTEFGSAFTECFTGITAPHPILRSISLIDTPGILEAAGEVHSRRYNYAKVCRWFVEKSDMVFFLFDPTKLDAGRELRQVFSESLRGHESKIRIVLNKADTVRPQELMRVYGALFWNLSNLVRTTEPPRLYVSSFWDRPYRNDTDHALFAKEKEDLLYELIATIPTQSLDRRVTAMLQRTQDVLLFVLVCATYRTRLPAVFGKGKAKDKFYEEYDDVIKELATRYHFSEDSFPTVESIREFLSKIDSSDFPDMEKVQKKGWIDLLKSTIDRDLPQLLEPIKEHAIVDPRDRKKAIMMQRQYIKQSAPANSNAAGTTASAGNASPSTSNDGIAAQLQAMQQMLKQMNPLQGTAAQPSGYTGLPSQQPAASTNDQQMQMMKQMMDSMLAQMQQNQQ